MINDVQHWRARERRNHRRMVWAYLAAAALQVLGGLAVLRVWPAFTLLNGGVGGAFLTFWLMNAAVSYGWVRGSDETMRQVVRDHDREAYPDET